MKMKKKNFTKLGKRLLVILLFVLLALIVYPVVFMITSSFKTPNEISMEPIYQLPKSFYYKNYVDAVQYTRIWMLFRNTIIVTLASVFLSLVMCATTSFALTKMQWRGQRVVSRFLTMGMFIPPFVLLLPQFLMLQRIGWLNSRQGLILIYCGITSLPIFLMNGFYRFLPDEVLEASVIDGCGIYRMFWYVVIPMSLNGYVTVVMMIFFSIWNDLLISRTFTSSQQLRMLQNGLAAFTDDHGGRNWGATFAAVTMATVPTIIVYLILNRKIIDGLTAGAVKG